MVVCLIAALGPPLAGSAGAVGEEAGSCAFVGEATVNPGIGVTPRVNNFQFTSAILHCVSSNPWLDGDYTAEIAGTSTGVGEVPSGPEGETCLEGRTAEPAQLTLVKSTGERATGQFEYERVGPNVLFWASATFEGGGPEIAIEGSAQAIPGGDSPEDALTPVACLQDQDEDVWDLVKIVILVGVAKELVPVIIEEVGKPVVGFLGWCLQSLIGLFKSTTTTSTTTTTLVVPPNRDRCP